MLMLNVGSGQRPFPKPWINLDIERRWENQAYEIGAEFLRWDMTALPYSNEEVSLIVCHQTYEHLDAFREGPAFLREAYRVLRPGGSLLLFVPDAEALARRWLRYRSRILFESNMRESDQGGAKAQEGEIDDFIFAVNMHGAYNGSESDRHRWCWCRDSLMKHLAENCPWSAVKDFDWREIPGMSAARDWWVLSVEAVK